MQYFQGKSVYKGIVMGPVAVLKKNDYQVKRARIEDPEAEVKRVKEAVEVSKKQLGRLYDKAVREVGEASAAIFEVHQMMLEDEDYLESMENMIRIELVNAEYAAAATGDNFAEMFAAMDDEYMKARSADVKDISERLVRNLSGEGDNDLSSMEPSIIVADDLSPSETVQMDKEKILAFVTVHGSTNSHTAILARMMNIPALIGVPMDLNSLKTGMTAVVDGFSGQVIFEPEEDVQKETEKRMQEEAEKQKLLEELKGKENITPDGRKINIYANIGSVGDLGYVMENDAGGIGLFRSEFLYLGRNDFPTEEEQFQAYKQAVQTMAGKKVIIRTLDIGADKQVEYFNLGKEENPALGYRAIRICLKQPEIFKAQLRALFRAAVYGNLSVMYPMITSTEEVEKIYAIVAVKDAENAVKMPEIRGEVTFDHVNFSYDESKQILKDVSFTVKPGESVALVGPTGAGKSTIVNLISRFYNVNGGRVLIDGQDISQVTIHSLREQMGIMMQDSFIFSGDIEDNIRYGKLDATREEIVKASRTVCADEFISKMPDRYQTEVRERGSMLSQGQKQLISFARTLLSDPAILILDEATSSIDVQTEKALQTGLNAMLKGRTSFIIAHRLSTIRNCDKIMYIDNGGIMESGTHDELMVKKGYYYKLYTAQLDEVQKAG